MVVDNGSGGGSCNTNYSNATLVGSCNKQLRFNPRTRMINSSDLRTKHVDTYT